MLGSLAVGDSPNPFRYGAVARGEYFADREQEVERLTLDALAGQDVVIISPRRVGKTSLVDRTVEGLRRRKAVVGYVDLFAVQSLPELADRLARGIFEGMLTRRRRLVEQAQEFMQRLTISPRLTVGEDGRPVFEFLGIERDQDLVPLLDELLGLSGVVAAEKQRPVVLVLDEFQQVVEIDRALPARFRAVFQQQPEVAHVYLGSKRHLMNRLFMERGEPLYRSAKPLLLGPIPPERFTAFLWARFQAGGVEVDDAAIEQILSLSGGLPYETQELCSFAWTRAVTTGRRVDSELVSRAFTEVLHAESARYVTILDELSLSQQRLLRAIARESGKVQSEAYRREHRLGAASTVQRALEGLRRRELVEPSEEGGYLVSDIFLRIWLRGLDRDTGRPG
jgi:uncharacterized protein